jgi:hypothetical protein
VSIGGLAHAADGSTLAGVEVCFHKGIVVGSAPTESDACTVSKSDGSFNLTGAPAKQDVTLMLRKDGLMPIARPMALEGNDVTLPANENVFLAGHPIFMGVLPDLRTGQIAFTVISTDGGPPAQVSATLMGYYVPNGAAGVVQRPVYADEKGAPAPGATAGSGGGFINVNPGLYMIRFHPTLGYCLPTSGPYNYAATADPNGDFSMLVPVIEGYLTAPVGVWCTSDGP